METKIELEQPKLSSGAMKKLGKWLAGLLVGALLLALLYIVGLCAYDRFWPHHPSDASMIEFFEKNRARFAEIEKVCTERRMLVESDHPACRDLAQKLGDFSVVNTGPTQAEVDRVILRTSPYEGFYFTYPLFFYHSEKGYFYAPNQAIISLNEVNAKLTPRAIGLLAFPDWYRGAVFSRLDNEVRDLGDYETAYRSIGGSWYLYYIEKHFH